jgi:hypothetical protein
MPTAIVSGALANKPLNGGEAWVRLSWALGLRRLGFDVYFVEEIDSGSCVDDSGAPADFAESANRAYFESVTRDFGLQEKAGLLCDGGREVAGLSLDELRAIATEADILFNISGHMKIASLLAEPRLRVYVDLDPGFTQAWHVDESISFRLEGHDFYVTVGLNVGASGWPIPACGIEWIPTLPPIVLDEWPQWPEPSGPPRLTTVARWRSPYGGLRIGDREMGLKHHQMRRMIELPERVDGASFEIALDIHPGDSKDLEALRRHGWRVVDPRDVAATPQAFRDYVRDSGAEFSVAQGVYVETGSGWFSDRTAAYLACGRPTLVQDTGIGEDWTREASLTFGSLDGAVSGAESLIEGYPEYGRAARAFALEHLDSDRVLSRLLDAVGVEG